MSYSDSLSGRLSSLGAVEGSRISVTRDGRTFVGTLMPHHEFSDPDVLIIKMKSGYNVGVRITDSAEVAVLEAPAERVRKETPVERREGLPRLVLIGTGGTIASYVDYRTGAVHPALSTSDMVNAVPEIRDIADVDARVLFSIFSENMGVEHWQKLAEAVAEEIRNGADGVIIPHGTDTMGYTAAALSFMLGNVSKPVVLVGAQRSSDRPSSDASSNLVACARFCTGGKRAGVYVVMHDTLGDDSFAVHLGTRVRKMHTSRRDAFRSINAPPVAHIDAEGRMEFSCEASVPSGSMEVRTAMEKSCVLLQYFPGMDPDVFEDVFMRSKGIVIAGSGLGHVNEGMIPLIRKADENGSVVVLTSQCLNGRTNLNVYNTGRDMLAAGAVTVLDMLPETAYVKLMWALANSSSQEEAKKIMRTPLAGEMSDRRTVDERRLRDDVRDRDPSAARHQEAVLLLRVQALRRRIRRRVQEAEADHVGDGRDRPRRSGAVPEASGIQVPVLPRDQLPRGAGRGAPARREPGRHEDSPDLLRDARRQPGGRGPLHEEDSRGRVQHIRFPEDGPDLHRRACRRGGQEGLDPLRLPGGGRLPPRGGQGRRGGLEDRPPGDPADRGRHRPGHEDAGGGDGGRVQARDAPEGHEEGQEGPRDDTPGSEHLNPRRRPHRAEGRGGAEAHPRLRQERGGQAEDAPPCQRHPEFEGRRPRGVRAGGR
ncbi:MAG: Glu-tRNA(Gln) amidotransferase subunit GatD, partial [Candidatus Methanomethylophilaceae archaeon]|nr:Glu-tRNA(Gln) amidotransferase subunit GatD [Candidatus Methanomethylophilaceae archaeon]